MKGASSRSGTVTRDIAVMSIHSIGMMARHSSSVLFDGAARRSAGGS
jgi:hypothetical protein